MIYRPGRLATADRRRAAQRAALAGLTPASRRLIVPFCGPKRPSFRPFSGLSMTAEGARESAARSTVLMGVVDRAGGPVRHRHRVRTRGGIGGRGDAKSGHGATASLS